MCSVTARMDQPRERGRCRVRQLVKTDLKADLWATKTPATFNKTSQDVQWHQNENKSTRGLSCCIVKSSYDHCKVVKQFVTGLYIVSLLLLHP